MQRNSPFALAVTSVLSLTLPSLVQAEIQRAKYEANGSYLVVEVLDDDLVHFEYGTGTAPNPDKSIETTDMVCKTTDNVPTDVCKTDYAGATQFVKSENSLETKEVKLQINPANLYVTVIDKTKDNVQLTTISPLSSQSSNNSNNCLPTPPQSINGLVFTRVQNLDLYGLGQQFRGEAGNNEINWNGKVRDSSEFGNVMEGFNGGANGNTQIPILYATKRGTQQNYAVFLDNKYKQRWDFTGQSQWKVESTQGKMRFYFFTGANLLDLRKDFMELVGKPLVPPKKMFGLWVSEYGYDNWQELDSKLKTLRDNNFPLDGFVLDLQWFGGITADSDETRMGALSWDETKFPNAKQKITDLKNTQGVGIVTIEEAYIGKNRPEHNKLNEQNCLVKKKDGTPVYLTEHAWWGKGGMLDYTNDACSDYWYDEKRKALIADGVMGHWTDLGEPEMYDKEGKYAEGTEADAHNIFNFKWIRGIYRGYVRNQIAQRPVMLSRSGTAGIQRFGAVMWSGDIGADWKNLATHAGNQANMSFSGIDYYGADIGGFHRGGINGDRLNDLYTQWYAFGALFDVPMRPHTENLCNCKETAPDKVGEKLSNLRNTQQRYELLPYLYSLAHRAYYEGEPVMPPLVMYYQTDSNVQSMGNEKMIGRDLLAAIAAKEGETEREVYLPAGTWFNWHTQEKIPSQGQYLSNKVSERDCKGLFRLPLYAREGAIIPLAFVDDQTLNTQGKRKDGKPHDELIAKVFAFSEGTTTAKNSFTLYEDDGETIAYQKGAIRTTEISQERQDNDITVTIDKSAGTYAGAIETRNNVIKLVVDHPVQKVLFNGNELSKFTKSTESTQTESAQFEQADTGWFKDENNTIIAKSGVMSVNDAKKFIFTLDHSTTTTPPPRCPIPDAVKFSCKNGYTTFGTSVYVVGNIPKLGLWNPAEAVKLDANGPYPTWTGHISSLPCGTQAIEWKCIKRLEGNSSAVVEWEPGTNNTFTKSCSGDTAAQEGDFKP